LELSILTVKLSNLICRFLSIPFYHLQFILRNHIFNLYWVFSIPNTSVNSSMNLSSAPLAR